MDERNGIRLYLESLERLGEQAEIQFLERNWPAQRNLQARALEAEDRLLRNAAAAVDESGDSPLHQAHAWACDVLGGRSADASGLAFQKIESQPWKRLENWGREPASLLEKAIDPAEFVSRCRRFAAAKGIEFGTDATFLQAPFFRNRRAYLVARAMEGGQRIPVLLALTVERERPELDAILTTEKEITPVFEFTRAPLIPRLADPLAFLPVLMDLLPSKPKWQILLNTGFSVLGQALMLAELREHLETEGNDGRFEETPGTPGMVMIVFHFPSFPIVFKVIKDDPDPPKEVGRADVLRKYRLVAEHDRVGRLAGSHLFEDLPLPSGMFAPELLNLLQQRAPSALRCDGDRIVFREVLVERRMIPLDLLLNDPKIPWEPLLEEYADAIEDLARANIFPGDLLPKNFGVTTFGRVVFYDYDDVDLTTSCQFRRLPDEDSVGRLLSIGPNDVFPEEWPRFLLREGPQRDYLVRHRPRLFDPEFWRACRNCYDNGGFIDLFPYQSQRAPGGT